MLIDSVSYYLSMIGVYSVLTVLLFVFPLIMWRSYLKNKGMVFRFLFCAITQTCYISNLVILLGFLKIASWFTLVLGLAAEYALVRWKTSWRVASASRTEPYSLKKALKGFKLSKVSSWLKHKWLETLMKLSKYKKWASWKWLCDNSIVIIALAAAVIYNMLFLNHSLLTDGHSYQASDIPVHLEWVYELMHGNLFSDGIYPFYMHSMIYAATTLSGIHLREVSLYYGVYQTLLLILSSYCLSKKLFCNKYLALMPVMLFSVLMNQTRYVASLPQECGMFATMCIAYFMLNYVQSKREHHVVSSDLNTKRKGLFRVSQYLMRYHIGVDAMLIMLSVSLVIGYHFYTAIAAIILILGFAITYFVRFLKKENWAPLLAAGIAGAVIAVAPFAVGLATGMKFQGSMDWATSILKGEEWNTDTSSDVPDVSVDDESDTQSGEESVGPVGDESALQSGSTTSDVVIEKPKVPLGERLSQMVLNAESLMFGKNSSKIAMACLGLSVVLFLISLLVKRFREVSLGYVAVGMYILLMMVLVSPKLFGLPELIQATRGGVFIQPFLVILYVVPLDIVFRMFGLLKVKGVKATISVVSAAATVACCVLLVRGGYLHNYFVTGSYYNENDYICKNIRENFPEKSFTIVSPTDDYYAVVDKGYHTELSELMYMIDGGKKEFTIPSEYVFFIVEKIAYKETYVTPQLAAQDMIYTGSIQDYQQRRLHIESKAYYWGRAMLKAYPNNFSVYFEDDAVIVYMLRQNTYYPFSLRIDYKSSLPSVGLEEELALAGKE